MHCTVLFRLRGKATKAEVTQKLGPREEMLMVNDDDDDDPKACILACWLNLRCDVPGFPHN